MEFIDQKIDDYSTQHTTSEKDYLAELNRETYQKILQPRMLSGHLQGRILSMFSKMIKPKRILEIGTYTGYSALCLAEGLAEKGVLHTIDRNEELSHMVNKYVDKAGFQTQIKQHVGDAMQIIPELNENWDLVFIDADKENYLNYYNMIIDKVNSGGLIIADNVLWSGKVLRQATTDDEETRILQELNNFIQKDSRVENVLFPVRDGLMVARKV
jgi:predicted O-methyltransferase YrrM